MNAPGPSPSTYALCCLTALLALGCEDRTQPPVRPPAEGRTASHTPPPTARTQPHPRPAAPGTPRAPTVRGATSAEGGAEGCFALPPSGEGMWPWADLHDPNKLEEAVLRRRGLKLRLAELWTPGRGGLASAVVGYGNGCTGSFISPRGLLITNHHCAFRTIQRNSTPERDLLREGFLARSTADELDGLGARIYVFRNQTDVTDRIVEGLSEDLSDLALVRSIEAREKKLVAECENKPHTRCRISRENDGLRFLLLENTEIKDVRLVAAPPRDLGNFGGEIDNFHWPRHTLDFTLMRAYVAPDGEPRAHHPENVPYRPKRHLSVASGGIEKGDLVMVLGTPGRTNRYATAQNVAWNEQFYYPFRKRLFREWIEILRDTAKVVPAARLPTASRVKALDNALTHAKGMIRGLERRRVLARKRAEEHRYRAWLAADPQRRARWGEALDRLIAHEQAAAKGRERDLLLRYLLYGVPLARTLRTVVKWAHERTRPDPERDPGYQERDLERIRSRLRHTQRSYHQAADKAVFAYFLKRLGRLPPDQRIQAFHQALGGQYTDRAIDAFLNRLYANTRLTQTDARLEALALPLEKMKRSPDAALKLGLKLHAELEAWQKRRKTREGARFRLRRPYLESLIAFRGRRFYPDANLTPRVSFAHVAGYPPRDGVWHRPFTHLSGLLAKGTGKPPFRVPAALRQAAGGGAGSSAARGAAATPGRDLPVNFLSNADTTGGNSGSPVLDGRGRFVGINFDRVYENISGDFGYRPETSRNIMVDVRYILWYLREVLRARWLLNELSGVTARTPPTPPASPAPPRRSR